ncbi:class I SAM-dependent methyltransferase [Agrobacterium sp. S2]|nr:class I SAM-dependent methyltransferase [Agrobacterium sp. S2]
MPPKHTPFVDQATVASYVENVRRIVPGLDDLHRMAMLLLAEEAPEAAHILVVGAGGGMEIRAMAEARPAWRFTGVDPSGPMLDLAHEMLQPVADRVDLRKGTVAQAPDGPFDGATCLLTLHHLDGGERLRTLEGIRRRLTPGANLIITEHTAPDPDPVRWMTRSVAFGDRDGLDWEKAETTGRMMIERLTLLSPADEESFLREAGFTEIALFYAALSFRGWIAGVGRP